MQEGGERGKRGHTTSSTISDLSGAGAAKRSGVGGAIRIAVESELDIRRRGAGGDDGGEKKGEMEEGDGEKE